MKYLKHKKNKLFIVLLTLITILLIAIDNRILIQNYQIETSKINNPIRIALITDLHSCKYKDNQKELIQALQNQSPDLVLLGGDIFDDIIEDTNTELFLAAIASKYPIYYVTGNHEYWSGIDKFNSKMKILEKYSITILSGKCDTVTLQDETINVCGVDDPDAYMVVADIETNPQLYIQSQQNKHATFINQLDEVNTKIDSKYSILLSHRPEFFELYASYDFDLVLSGHAHGGQWRIPGILNGVYAPHQGLFPKYAGGMYELGDTTMIVSRGLAKETTRIPRIFNRPELVIVEVS